jgi:hypothetical protein
MQSTELVLVSVTAPESMEEPIAAEMLALGAPGYTAWTVRGRGVHGARPSTWTGANVRVETAVSPELAERIVARMLEKHTPAVPLMVMTRAISVHQRGLF